jgi:TetR/AcrR family transcriptional regulator, mexJK operon transcriptional repressor
LTSSGPPSDAPTDVRAESRSARKRRAILEAGTTLFLRHGYRGTSMDEIAAAAGVSKQTVYKHFADKESLFSEIVISTVEEVAKPVHDEVLKLQDSGDLEADLRRLARQLLRRVIQPRILQLRRLVIGGAGRFPELGRTFYEQGPGPMIAALTTVFERLADQGVLQPGDPLLAAAHFNWLVMSIPLNRAMLLGDDEPPPPPRSTGTPTPECAPSSPPTRSPDRASTAPNQELRPLLAPLLEWTTPSSAVRRNAGCRFLLRKQACADRPMRRPRLVPSGRRPKVV